MRSLHVNAACGGKVTMGPAMPSLCPQGKSAGVVCTTISSLSPGNSCFSNLRAFSEFARICVETENRGTSRTALETMSYGIARRINDRILARDRRSSLESTKVCTFGNPAPESAHPKRPRPSLQGPQMTMFPASASPPGEQFSVRELCHSPLDGVTPWFWYWFCWLDRRWTVSPWTWQGIGTTSV